MGAARILIVDDDEILRKALARWFTLRGFEVSIAADGDVAVDLCQGHDYDVILMDLVMPRMSGVDAIREIKRAQPDTPILVLTGFHENSIAALDAGAARILSKPIRLDDLEAEVRNLLPGD